MNKVQNTNGILPNEIFIMYIFPRLSSFKDILRCNLVCKQWRDYACDNKVWEKPGKVFCVLNSNNDDYIPLYQKVLLVIRLSNYDPNQQIQKKIELQCAINPATPIWNFTALNNIIKNREVNNEDSTPYQESRKKKIEETQIKKRDIEALFSSALYQAKHSKDEKPLLEKALKYAIQLNDTPFSDPSALKMLTEVCIELNDPEVRQKTESIIKNREILSKSQIKSLN